jgi:hypothetical protein
MLLAYRRRSKSTDGSGKEQDDPQKHTKGLELRNLFVLFSVISWIALSFQQPAACLEI